MIKVNVVNFKNREGELVEGLAINHPNHEGLIRLLNKQNEDKSEFTVDEMIAYLKETPNWRNMVEVKDKEFVNQDGEVYVRKFAILSNMEVKRVLDL